MNNFGNSKESRHEIEGYKEMKYKSDKFKINKKRDELNKLIQENLSNLLIDEILEVSQELDNLISSYLFSQNYYKKTSVG